MKPFKDFDGRESKVVVNMPNQKDSERRREREERWKLDALCKDGLEHEHYTVRVLEYKKGLEKKWEQGCRKCSQVTVLELCGAIDNEN